jgi:FixJ family two-component response regulator
MPANTLISVVDDDPSMSRMLARIIMAAGFDVQAFPSAEAFLQAGQINDSACLILDVDLPGMNGLELQQKLNDSGHTLPIIFISAEASEAMQQKMLDSGAIGFFKKPFSIDSLLTKVRSVDSNSYLVSRIKGRH